MNLTPIHTSWLIPGEQTPCDIYFYFRGSYIVGLKEGTPISVDFLSKLHKTEYPLAYREEKTDPAWNSWIAQRHPHLNTINAGVKKTSSDAITNQKKQLYGNKRAEYVSFMQKAVILRQGNDPHLRQITSDAVKAVRSAIQSPMWDWYFNRFHEPPNLFHHSARVTYLVALFSLSSGFVNEESLTWLIQASLIHELSGDPEISMSSVTSEKTIAELEEEKYPISKSVIDIIRLQDELMSGAGFPKNLSGEKIPTGVRIFSLCNHFDHYRLKSQGSRRVRLDYAKKIMQERKEDYDPQLWIGFWQLVEESFEVIG